MSSRDGTEEAGVEMTTLLEGEALVASSPPQSASRQGQ